MNNSTKQALYDICSKYRDVFIIDMFNYIFKYYFANRELSVTRDEKVIPTGHFYGITRQVIYLKEKFPNCAIIFAVDGYDKTRREVNQDYKSGRVHEIEPRDYVEEILKLCSLVDGIYSCFDENYEADDVIGSISTTIKALCDKNKITKRVYVLSSDKDMYQLIRDDGYCRINSITKFGHGENWVKDTEVIDEKRVKEVFEGVEPRDLLKFRAIVGDSSDNLRGYFRYRKSNASIIASNFDYDSENHVLKLKNGVPMRETWRKPLATILEDFSIFENNYKIMGLKRFDFEIETLGKNMSDEDVKSVVELIDLYELNVYMSSVTRYSPYRDKIDEYSKTLNTEEAIGTVMCDLETLLS